jgi:KDO2-lipid IV(A) lauroyltransferase
LLYRAILVLSFIGRSVPLGVGRALGRALGRLAWHVARRERRKALAHVAIAFPSWSDAERRTAIRAMFQHLGMSLFEIMWLPNVSRGNFRNWTEVVNEAPTQALLDAGRGVIAFTGHCGNWEWVAYTVGLLGMPLAALQRERSESGMNEFIAELRLRANVKTIDRGSASSSREMLQTLRRGGMLAFLIDQNIRAESVKVPFFGKPALTPIGPAKFAIRTGAAVVGIFIERRADGTHLVRFNDPIETKRDDDPVALTAQMTAQIEEQIRRAPEQWVWMHERWRERPKWDVSAR